MEILTLEEIKNYLRIDYDEDDKLLQSLQVAATAYLQDAICDLEQRMKKRI